MWKIALDPIDAIHSVRKMVQFVNCSVRGLNVNNFDPKNVKYYGYDLSSMSLKRKYSSRNPVIESIPKYKMNILL